MVQMSSKTFIAVIALVTVIAVLIAVGLILGWFAPLSGAGGVFASGLFEVFAFIPRFVVQGWPQMLVGVCLAVAVIFFFGYVFEQRQVIATLRGQNQTSAGDYQDSPSQNIIPLDTPMQNTPTQKEE